MNILILSAGTRTKIVQYFKDNIENKGKVIATDCDSLAPALYFSDKFYITPKITEKDYLTEIVNICKKEKVDGIISLIDPELSILSQNKKIFNDLSIKLFMPEYDVTQVCFDKYRFFSLLNKHNIYTPYTYNSIIDFKKDYRNGLIKFPVFIKPRTGSASLNISIINDIETLEIFCKNTQDLIIQEFIKGKEVGVDAYFDYFTNELIEVFMKEKLKMRAGETDKSKSIINNEILDIIIKVSRDILNLKGPIDFDFFVANNKIYLSEINPRFGGGYPHAYECGKNFIELILNNLEGPNNATKLLDYKEGIYMMKYNDLIIQ